MTVNGKAVEAHLCPECANPFLEIFAEFEEIGRPVKAEKATASHRRPPVARTAGGPHVERREGGRGVTVGRFPITRQPTLADHETDEEGKYPCGYCDVTWPSPGSRGSHRYRAHGIRSQKPIHECPFCDYQNAKPGRIITHVRHDHQDVPVVASGEWTYENPIHADVA